MLKKFTLPLLLFSSLITSCCSRHSSCSQDHQVELSRLPCYPAPLTVSQIVSNENNDPVVVAKLREDSSRIWKEIHKNLLMQGDTIPIVAYGSLMNPISAASTLKSYHVESSSAAWLHGYVRSFNLDSGLWRKKAASGLENGPQDRGILNLIKAPGQRCNVVILDINEADFIAARKREGMYRLLPVKICSYPSETSCRVAYVWVAEEKLCSREILPVRDYYRLVWLGVASAEAESAYGKNFSKDFLETSFLADGSSVLSIHEEYKSPKVLSFRN